MMLHLFVTVLCVFVSLDMNKNLLESIIYERSEEKKKGSSTSFCCEPGGLHNLSG